MLNIGSLIRRGFHEVPHFMIGGTIFALCGPLSVYCYLRSEKYDRERRQWKRRYTVVREEDFNPKKQVHPLERKYPYWIF